ncbi:MAG: Trypsin-like serine protease typically periplasmic containing C-terminal PDZ [Rhodospirillaceae bacterium]|nr:MAG: Trypsin-like serine protease typically periplasmic containing C-terminal PDZ [Rhodospirillaceae bacterium]TNC98072.1 MAG: Trypsin-like serine protease typically periplasmic, containing C-terminal PDZ domain [Stygiobacter sp.]
MGYWPRLLMTAALLASAGTAFAQTPDPVTEKEAQVQSLRQRAEALKAALAGDVCADPAGTAALLKAGPTALREGKAETVAKTDTPPAEVKGDVQPLSRKDLVDRLHKAVVLVIADNDTGSGFFITPDMVVTNHHVISGAKSGQVMVIGRGLDAPMPAQVVAHTNSQGQNERDYAILRVNGAKSATTLPLVLDAGELSNVVAAGFPGLLLDTDMNFRALIKGDMKAMPELAMSQGAIMAVQNRGRGLPVIAHSAPISGGNSGGPLVDMCGRVLGINTFINVAEKQGTNAGFALAANDLTTYLRANGVSPTIASGGCAGK